MQRRVPLTNTPWHMHIPPGGSGTERPYCLMSSGRSAAPCWKHTHRCQWHETAAVCLVVGQLCFGLLVLTKINSRKCKKIGYLLTPMQMCVPVQWDKKIRTRLIHMQLCCPYQNTLMKCSTVVLTIERGDWTLCTIKCTIMELEY